MSNIAARRCFNHAVREAVARCQVCGNFYCRECIADHDDKMICARCLLPKEIPDHSSRFFSVAVRIFQAVAGLLILWLFFFLVGQGLIKLPTSFHDGTFWSSAGSDR